MNRLSRLPGVLVMTLACAAGACGGRAAETPAAPPSPPSDGTITMSADSPMLKQLRVAPVVMADVPTEEVVAPGKVEANPNRVSRLLLPVAGRVTAVLVKLGDTVAKDQPLLTLESPDADSAVSAFLSSQAAVNQAQAALIKAQADFERASDLFEHNAVAKKEVLAAESGMVQAKSAADQAHASREQAERHLALLGLNAGDFRQQLTVRAPLSGKVLDLSVVPGEYRNDVSTSVMTIADLSTVWISSQVPESYIRFVQKGEPVTISLVAYPGEVFDGRVSRIADTVDPQTRTIKVQAELTNTSGRLRPEMFGSIHHTESMTRAPVVPSGAVVQAETTSAVFVERSPGRFEQRTVTLGSRQADTVRVLSGLSEGDRVVVDGVMLLKGLARKG